MKKKLRKFLNKVVSRVNFSILFMVIIVVNCCVIVYNNSWIVDHHSQASIKCFSVVTNIPEGETLGDYSQVIIYLSKEAGYNIDTDESNAIRGWIKDSEWEQRIKGIPETIVYESFGISTIIDMGDVERMYKLESL